MESIKHTSSQINTNAQKVYLTWNGYHVLKSNFGQIPQDVFLYPDKDTYLGIVEYPNSVLGDKNKYLVLERDGKLIRAPFKYKPYWIEYGSHMPMKERLQLTQIWGNTENHQIQFHAWNKVLKDYKLEHLYLAARQFTY